MNEASLRNGILGSLATAGLGDALGAGTEQWTIEEIFEAHNGPIATLIQPPPDTFAGAEGNLKGQITDDTSQMYYLAEDIIAADGVLDAEVWKDCLLRWADNSPHVGNMGPSTRPMVEALRTGGDPHRVGLVGTSDRQVASMGATNGSSMRVAPAGLIHPGDLEGACQAALVTCIPTHNTNIAIAAACAIASGCAEGLKPDADPFSVVQACLWGARRGEELARTHPNARVAPGPSIARRTQLAVQLGMAATSLRQALDDIEALIGNSVMACESIPAAIGVFIHAQGDPWDTIVAGSSLGNDTDTVAAIAGSLAGALRGFGTLPQDTYATFAEANRAEHDLERIADGLVRIALGNLS